MELSWATGSNGEMLLTSKHLATWKRFWSFAYSLLCLASLGRQHISPTSSQLWSLLSGASQSLGQPALAFISLRTWTASAAPASCRCAWRDQYRSTFICLLNCRELLQVSMYSLSLHLLLKFKGIKMLSLNTAQWIFKILATPILNFQKLLKHPF